MWLVVGINVDGHGGVVCFFVFCFSLDHHLRDRRSTSISRLSSVCAPGVCSRCALLTIPPTGSSMQGRWQKTVCKICWNRSVAGRQAGGHTRYAVSRRDGGGVLDFLLNTDRRRLQLRSWAAWMTSVKTNGLHPSFPAPDHDVGLLYSTQPSPTRRSGTVP